MGLTGVSPWNDVKAIGTYRGRPEEANRTHPMIRVTKKDRVANEDLRKTSRVQDLIKTIK